MSSLVDISAISDLDNDDRDLSVNNLGNHPVVADTIFPIGAKARAAQCLTNTPGIFQALNAVEQKSQDALGLLLVKSVETALGLVGYLNDPGHISS